MKQILMRLLIVGGLVAIAGGLQSSAEDTCYKCTLGGSCLSGEGDQLFCEHIPPASCWTRFPSPDCNAT